MTALLVIVCIVGYLILGFAAAFVIWKNDEDNMELPIVAHILIWPISLPVFIVRLIGNTIVDSLESISDKIEDWFSKIDN